MKAFALLRTSDSPRYGVIMEKFKCENEAYVALNKECQEVRVRYPNALTDLMYAVCELPTPAGDSGEVGERIKIDLTL